MSFVLPRHPVVIDFMARLAGHGADFLADLAKDRVIPDGGHLRRFAAYLTPQDVGGLAAALFKSCNAVLQRGDARRGLAQGAPYRGLIEEFQNV